MHSCSAPASLLTQETDILEWNVIRSSGLAGKGRADQTTPPSALDNQLAELTGQSVEFMQNLLDAGACLKHVIHVGAAGRSGCGLQVMSIRRNVGDRIWKLDDFSHSHSLFSLCLGGRKLSCFQDAAWFHCRSTGTSSPFISMRCVRPCTQ
ncbi:hypothetical protein CO648_07740 [Rhizobium phaseoli]|nr:hypothetical protein CO648_07740 [Rhizobium phaseoli]